MMHAGKHAGPRAKEDFAPLFIPSVNKMAYVLTQMPVHCGTVQLLKEPDILPNFKYLFEKEHGPVMLEDSEGNSDTKPEQNSEENDVIIVDIVTREDQKTTTDVKTHVKRFVEASFEDQKTTIDVKTHVESFEQASFEDPNTSSDVKSEVKIEKEEEVIEVISCEDEVIDVVSCEEEVVDVVTCEEKVSDVPVSSEDLKEAAIFADAGAIPEKPRIQELSIPLEKLRFTTNCINKKPELEEDEYIFCSKCDKLRVGNCPVHDSLKWVEEPSVVVEKEGLTRARSTIPNNMDLKTSSIPDAGLGIFAKEKFESDVVFGPYWGEKIDVADLAPNMDQSYMWDIIENGHVTHVVDARDEKYSNWLRFVNCARNDDEQNLVAFQFRGEIYYRSYKVIEPGMELLVWYGDKYACDLDILNKDQSDKIADGPIQCQKCFMVCSGPASLASHNKFRCQMNNEHHLWRCIHCDRSFKTQSGLQRHKNIHKGIKPYACRICGNVFSHPSSRDRHYRLHFIEACNCMMCGKEFGDTISLGCHERTFHSFKRHSNGKFECIECRKLFVNWKCLRRHKKRVLHTKADAFGCKTCGKLFLKRSNFLRHQALHRPSGLCKEEGNSNKGGKHQKIAPNTLQKGKAHPARHVCEICKGGFKYSFNLARHIREKHPKVKIAKCGKCSKVFTDKHRLAVHIAIQHANKDGSKPHSLDKKQGHSQGQHAHVRKRFRCEFCSKAFSSSSLMHCHRASHFRKANPTLPVASVNSPTAPTEESTSVNNTECSKGKVRCEICYKAFPSKQLMHCHRASHFRIKTPGQQASCERCHKSFNSNKSLRQHKCFQAQNATMSSRNALQSNVPQSDPLLKSSPESPGFHAGRNSLSCPICARKFTSKASLNSHKSHHSRSSKTLSPSNQPLAARQEGQGSFTSSPVIDSKASKTGSDARTKLEATNKQQSCVCDICNKSFQSGRSLSQHKRYHLERDSAFVCSFCDGKFASWSTLLAHKRHKHSRLYKHDRCGERHFTYKHSPCFRFACSHCDRRFISVSGRYKHMRKYHSEQPIVGPWKCQYCSKEFKSVKGMRVHVYQRHSKENSEPYKRCEAGGKVDVKSINKVAERTQTCSKLDNDFHWKCQDCGKELQSYSGMKRHLRKKHGKSKGFEPYKVFNSEGKDGVETFSSDVPERPKTWTKPAEFTPCSCQYCSKKFQSESGLNKHIKKRHAKKERRDPCQMSSGIKTTITEVTEGTQTSSKPASSASWKCQYCSKEYLSYWSMKRHTKKKHAKKKKFDHCELNSGIETTIGEVTEGTKTNSKPARCASRKCQYCSKQFQSNWNMKRHVKKKHTEEKKFDSYRVGKLTEKGRAEATSSEMAKETQECRRCQAQFFSFGSCTKHTYCFNCSRELALEENAAESGLKNHIAGDFIRGGRRTIVKKRKDLNSARAFQCQYCLKGLSSVNSLYKHITIVHSNDIGLIPQESCNHEDDQSVRTDMSNSQTNTTQEREEVNQISDGETNDLKGLLGGVRFRSDRNKPCKAKGQHTNSNGRIQCRYCDMRFFSISGRWRHEVKMHDKPVRTYSLKSKLEVDNNGANQTSEERPLPGDDSLSALKNDDEVSRACTVGPDAEDCHLGSGSFTCEYCPRQFLRISSRYKHVVLVHTRAASSSTNESQPDQNVLVEGSSGKTGQVMLFKDDHSPCSPSTAAKRKKTTSSSDDQPELKRPRRYDHNLEPSLDDSSTSGSSIISDVHSVCAGQKAFPCDFCDKTFCTFSLQCKHFFLVHSGSQALAREGLLDSKAELADKVLERPASLFSVASSECENSTMQQGSSSQSAILEQCIPDTDNSSPSVSGAASDPNKCGIRHTTLRRRTEGTKHFNEDHYGKAGEDVRRSINGLSRPPLRTISSSVQNSDKLKSLRRRRSFHNEETFNKPVEMASTYRSKDVNFNYQSRTKLTKKRFKCDICLSSFCSQASASRHKQTLHSNERPFQCNICGFATKRKDTLSFHQRSHPIKF